MNPTTKRRLKVMGSNVDETTASLALKIRQKMHFVREYGGAGYESEARRAIQQWEDWTGKTWTGERPEPTTGGAA